MAKKIPAKRNTAKTKAAPAKAMKPEKRTRERKRVEEQEALTTVAPKADLPAELRQLAEIRVKLPALSKALAAKLLAQHADDACRERGSSTKSTDIFRGGMTWARTIGEQVDKPGFSPALSRWFLDCLTVLGQHVTGAPTSKNPSEEASYQDVSAKVDKLLSRTRARLKSAAGSNATHKAALAEAFDNEGALDERVATLREVGALVQRWLGADDGPPLEAYDITDTTSKELASASKELEEAIARKPAPQQADRDSPIVNISEGRVLFAMRPIWDRLAEAREDNKTSVTLTVSPAILRGLDIGNRNKKKLL